MVDSNQSNRITTSWELMGVDKLPTVAGVKYGSESSVSVKGARVNYDNRILRNLRELGTIWYGS
jgi:hypothetical protein